MIKNLKSAKRIEKESDLLSHLEKRVGNKSSFKACEKGYEVKKSYPMFTDNSDIFKDVMADEGRLKAAVEAVGVTWKDSYKDRVKRYWASDQRADSDGDIIIQNWDFSTFKDNPVMPYNHQWNSEHGPIGTHLAWEVIQRNSDKYQGPALALLSLFADAEVSKFADGIFRLVDAGFLRMGSIGAIAHDMYFVEDEDERAELGLGDWGLLLDNMELLEYSPTAIGANQGAFQILNSAKAGNKIQPSDLNVARELNRQLSTADPDAWKNSDDQYIAMAKTLFPTYKFDVHSEILEPFQELELVPENQVHMLGNVTTHGTVTLHGDVTGNVPFIDDLPLQTGTFNIETLMLSDEDVESKALGVRVKEMEVNIIAMSAQISALTKTVEETSKLLNRKVQSILETTNLLVDMSLEGKGETPTVINGTVISESRDDWFEQVCAQAR